MQTTVLISIPIETFQSVIIDSVNFCLSRHQESQTPQKEKESKLLTRKETAELLGVSLVTLNEWTRSGRIPCIKIGTRVRYEIAEVFSSIKKG